MGQSVVVLGAQWGDEGKGKIVDLLTERAAAGRDPGFYAFQRSLEAYRRSFQDGNTVIVLDKDDPFLQYMRTDR